MATILSITGKIDNVATPSGPDVAVTGQPMRAGSAPEISFEPEDIEVSAKADARFVVG